MQQYFASLSKRIKLSKILGLKPRPFDKLRASLLGRVYIKYANIRVVVNGRNDACSRVQSLRKDKTV
jgi:hypothetical protein